ncbi:MAG: rhomboid family intramembrane serine protease [Calditrichaeota bacterium]|nr:MAG: rhomboid family intramembrane serine protease [Calditrichota bacterium]
MIPISDDSPRNYIPYVNYLLIALNVIFYMRQPSDPQALAYYFNAHGLIPYEVVTNLFTVTPLLHIFTSMFIHGGLWHLTGNMLYLWIFGDNIEYYLGHIRYLLFYFVVGIGAALMQIVFSPLSQVPMVGASGAISGVLGAYLLKFPRNRVNVLVFFIFMVRVPAAIILSLWFLMQVYNALFATVAGGGGGVAWLAHVGGFIAGFIFIKRWDKKRLSQPGGYF